MRNAISELGLSLQKAIWTRRAESWEQMENPGLNKVVDAVLEFSNPQSLGTAIDLGCGSGQLALPLARRFEKVIAVDISPKMIEILEKKAKDLGLSNVETQVGALQHLNFAPKSVDLVVSNYVLHHLSDLEKAKIIKSSAEWLRPGGQIVIGDMMFGRGLTPQDREIIASKLVEFVKRGPGGWWRIIKNVGRFVFRLQEKPISQSAWRRIFESAGLVDIEIKPIVAEAAVGIARRS
jgi:ubiquinone/menaquinone biosynthesis C-methylase UbiE